MTTKKTDKLMIREIKVRNGITNAHKPLSIMKSVKAGNTFFFFFRVLLTKILMKQRKEILKKTFTLTLFSMGGGVK